MAYWMWNPRSTEFGGKDCYFSPLRAIDITILPSGEARLSLPGWEEDEFPVFTPEDGEFNPDWEDEFIVWGKIPPEIPLVFRGDGMRCSTCGWSLMNWSDDQYDDPCPICGGKGQTLKLSTSFHRELQELSDLGTTPRVREAAALLLQCLEE